MNLHFASSLRSHTISNTMSMTNCIVSGRKSRANASSVRSLINAPLSVIRMESRIATFYRHKYLSSSSRCIFAIIPNVGIPSKSHKYAASVNLLFGVVTKPFRRPKPLSIYLVNLYCSKNNLAPFSAKCKTVSISRLICVEQTHAHRKEYIYATLLVPVIRSNGILDVL